VSAIVTLAGESDGDVAVAQLNGEIDSSNVHEIGARLRAALTNRSTAMVVDLTEVRYLDSAGINLLFTLADELRGRQQALHMVVPSGSPVARMLTITGLDQAHPTHRTLAEASAATGAGS
jgi:stage II sporulation protein AA (anti-sigma F factor antagonist)